MNASQKATVRLLPVSFSSIIAGFANGHLNVCTNVFTGNLSFVNKDAYLSANRDGYKLGMSYGRSMVYIDDIEKYQTISHEIVHLFQFEEYQSLNPWLLPLIRKIQSEPVKILFSKYVYLDIHFMGVGYVIEGKHAYPNFYKNFYEFEA